MTAFVVGHVEAGIATLISPDLRVVEFPAALLPSEVHGGSVVRVQVAHNEEDDARRVSKFRVLQDSILHDFGRLPTWSIVTARATHHTITVTWDPPAMFNAKGIEIRVYLNRALVQRLAPSVTSLRLTLLSPNSPYDIDLVLMSSAGKSSHAIKVSTSLPTDLSAVMLAFYAKSNEELLEWQNLAKAGGVAYASVLSGETSTHLVTSKTAGERISTANRFGIPVVSPAWLTELCTKHEVPALPAAPSSTSV